MFESQVRRRLLLLLLLVVVVELLLLPRLLPRLLLLLPLLTFEDQIVGWALDFYLPPLLVQPSHTLQANKDGLNGLYLGSAVCSIVLFLMAYMYFPDRPPHAPSASAAEAAKVHPMIPSCSYQSVHS